MARNRTIKPEFWTSEQVMDCSIEACALFIGIWNFSDDGGRHPANTKRIKAEVFPSRDVTDSDVGRWIGELLERKLLRHYEIEGRGYWEVTGWKAHQTVQRPTYLYPDDSGTIPMSHNGKRYGNGKEQAIPGTFQDHSRNVPATTERNATERNLTDYVRPFVASDHFELWPEAIRRAALAAKRLWPKKGPREIPDRDRDELKKLAFLSLTAFSENWFNDAVNGTIVKKANNPAAYLRGILRDTAKKQGRSLNDLLDSVEIPAKQPTSPGKNIDVAGLLKNPTQGSDDGTET